MRKSLLSKPKVKVRLPGGETAVRVVKRPGRPRCGICGGELHGVDYAGKTKSQRSVERLHGGSVCARCLKHLLVREVLSRFG